jgi:hypothetical protein
MELDVALRPLFSLTRTTGDPHADQAKILDGAARARTAIKGEINLTLKGDARLFTMGWTNHEGISGVCLARLVTGNLSSTIPGSLADAQ